MILNNYLDIQDQKSWDPRVKETQSGDLSIWHYRFLMFDEEAEKPNLKQLQNPPGPPDTSVWFFWYKKRRKEEICVYSYQIT